MESKTSFQKRPKPSKSDITREELLATKTLQSNTNIIILSTNNGNATVAMGKLEYSDKLAGLDGDGNDSKVKKDTTLKTAKLSEILNKNKDYTLNNYRHSCLNVIQSCFICMLSSRFTKVVFH